MIKQQEDISMLMELCAKTNEKLRRVQGKLIVMEAVHGDTHAKELIDTVKSKKKEDTSKKVVLGGVLLRSTRSSSSSSLPSRWSRRRLPKSWTSLLSSPDLIRLLRNRGFFALFVVPLPHIVATILHDLTRRCSGLRY